jgi:hypothetical protein
VKQACHFDELQPASADLEAMTAGSLPPMPMKRPRSPATKMMANMTSPH